MIEQCDGLEFMNRLEDGSVDLVLTDPPYMISNADSGVHKTYLKKKNKTFESKTQDELNAYEQTNGTLNSSQKNNYLKYGDRWGIKFASRSHYGEWDDEFTFDTLEQFVRVFYAKLKKGGTLIVFFDLWKIHALRDLFKRVGFSRIRLRVDQEQSNTARIKQRIFTDVPRSRASVLQTRKADV